MSLCCYLAMTEEEIRACGTLPPHMAYMACHFSIYGAGLMNLPQKLPAGSILILNDRVPVLHHSPELVALELFDACKRLCVKGVLLDFEIPGNLQTRAIVDAVLQALSCPVCVSEPYAEGRACPVFLCPPIHIPLKAYLEKWASRPIWLEASCLQECFHITTAGCAPKRCEAVPEGKFFTDAELCCRYTFSLSERAADFTLWRQGQEVSHFLKQAEEMGIEIAIGLYQQLSA